MQLINPSFDSMGFNNDGFRFRITRGQFCFRVKIAWEAACERARRDITADHSHELNPDVEDRARCILEKWSAIDSS